MNTTHIANCQCHKCWEKKENAKMQTKLEQDIRGYIVPHDYREGCRCMSCATIRAEKEPIEEAERVYKEGAAKRRQEEMERAEELIQKAKGANSRDRLLDSLIETNSYLIKLHEANKFNAQHLLELMRINTINHATIMKEIR